MTGFTAARLEGEVKIEVPANRGTDLCIYKARVTDSPAVKAHFEGLARDGLLRRLAGT